MIVAVRSLSLFALVVAALAITTRARAERFEHMVPRLVDESGFLRRHDPSQSSTEGPLSKKPKLALPSHIFGFHPHVTILARDWSEAFAITDGHPLVFDRLTMVRSSRMAVTRFTLNGGRFTPYVEISGGQWRIDPDLFPRLPRDTEFAAGAAFGFELRLSTAVAVAWSMEKTVIHRPASDWGSLPVTSVRASYLGVRAEF